MSTRTELEDVFQLENVPCERCGAPQSIENFGECVACMVKTMLELGSDDENL
jgi:hypothetical protein